VKDSAVLQVLCRWERGAVANSTDLSEPQQSAGSDGPEFPSVTLSTRG